MPVSGFLKLARALSRRRRTAGVELGARVQRELGELAMEKTRFEVAFQPLEAAGDGEDTTQWSERGLDAVEFLLSPNPGEELRPLARIASGGELSRILLALNAVAAVDAAAETLVFDEVDAGIGGRVAEVVGRKLRSGRRDATRSSASRTSRRSRRSPTGTTWSASAR